MYKDLKSNKRRLKSCCNVHLQSQASELSHCLANAWWETDHGDPQVPKPKLGSDISESHIWPFLDNNHQLQHKNHISLKPSRAKADKSEGVLMKTKLLFLFSLCEDL